MCWRRHRVQGRAAGRIGDYATACARRDTLRRTGHRGRGVQPRLRRDDLLPGAVRPSPAGRRGTHRGPDQSRRSAAARPARLGRGDRHLRAGSRARDRVGRAPGRPCRALHLHLHLLGVCGLPAGAGHRGLTHPRLPGRRHRHRGQPRVRPAQSRQRARGQRRLPRPVPARPARPDRRAARERPVDHLVAGTPGAGRSSRRTALASRSG